MSEKTIHWRRMSAREDLARLLEQATEGPWLNELDPDDGVRYVVVREKKNGDAVGFEPIITSGYYEMGADVALIVWLRNHADRLLALWEAADTLAGFGPLEDTRRWTGMDTDPRAALIRARAALAALESTEGT